MSGPLTKRERMDGEIAFATMALREAKRHKMLAEKNKVAARRHIYHAWLLCGNVARVARALGLSRPYVSNMVARARRENEDG
jgi:hypothetical protein